VMEGEEDEGEVLRFGSSGIVAQGRHFSLKRHGRLENSDREQVAIKPTVGAPWMRLGGSKAPGVGEQWEQTAQFAVLGGVSAGLAGELG
jgi:hypothetical protein